MTAMQLGHVTRNAVIGKWHRMGLMRAPKQRARMRAKTPRKRKETIAKTPKRLPPTFFAEPLPPPAETDIARVSLMDLERHHCRWPVGEPVEGYCGCKPVEGLPYCEPHARRAYTPATIKAEPGPSFNVNIRRPMKELVDA
jgi:GcrA cell cycle regulator